MFLFFLIGFLFGSFLRVFFPSERFWLLTGFVTLSGIVFWSVCPRFKNFFAVVVFFGAFFLGAYRADIYLSETVPETDWTNKEIHFVGTVIKEPTRGSFSQRAPVSLRECGLSDQEGIDCPFERILLKTDPYDDRLALRRTVEGRCRLEKPRNFGKFDYASYLRARKIHYLCTAENLEIRSSPNAFDRIYAKLIHFRHRLEENLVRAVGQPQAALAAGLLFGGDERLSEFFQEKFQRTGLTHIVAVSGFNVTVISQYAVLAGIFVGLRRSRAVYLAIAAVFVFVASIGFPAPAVRAGLMGVLVLLLMRSGRTSGALAGLLLASAMMVFHNPLIVRYDIGFQLSFLATLGIIVVYPLFERAFLRGGAMKFWREILLLTLSAQAFVLPVLIYHFGVVSTVSLLSNVLVLPVIPAAMLAAFATSLVGFVSASAAVLTGLAVYAILGYVLAVVDFLADLPWAVFELSLPVGVLVLYYFFLGAVVWILSARFNRCSCTTKESKKR